MNLSRRNFLKWASLSAVGAVSCNFFDDREMTIQSPLMMPEDLVQGDDNWYATLCSQCPEKEGIVVRVMQGRAKKIQGNPLYPTNYGKQSARCEGGLQELYHPDRITKPLLLAGPRGSGRFVEITWDDAFKRVHEQLSGLQAGGNQHQALTITEPLRGHLGTVVDSITRAYGGRHMVFQPFEETVLRSAVKDVFDQDSIPLFDIAGSDYLLSFGADLLSTWISPVAYSRGYGQFRDMSNGHHRGYHVHVDPRYSMTSANADQWIPVSPGTEGVLALSIASVIVSEGLVSPEIISMATGNLGPSALDEYQPERIIATLGVPERIRGEPSTEIIRRIAREFASAKSALAIGGGSTGAHTNGQFNLRAIYSLNYLVGSVGKKPGQGGIVFNPSTPLQSLQSKQNFGTLGDWKLLSQNIRDHEIRVLLLKGANLSHGLPNAIRLEESVSSGRPFIINFSSFLDETSLLSDLVLPERSYLEEWGDDVPEPGPGYQVVGFQQPVVNPLPDLDPRSFPDFLMSLSQSMGVNDGLPNTFEAVLRNSARQLYDLGRGSIQAGSPNEFWNNLLQQGGWWDINAISDAPVPPVPNFAELARSTKDRVLPNFKEVPGGKNYYLVPFQSNALLDGRGAHLPWLQATPDPLTTVTWQTWVEINLQEANRLNLKEGDIVIIESSQGNIEALVYVHPANPTGVVSVPLGQGHSSGVTYATKDGKPRGSNLISILSDATDETTGALAWAANKVTIHTTGRNARVSKFEGIVTAYPFGSKEEDIVKVTNGHHT